VVGGRRHPCCHDTKEVAWRGDFGEKAWWMGSLRRKGLPGLPGLVMTTPMSVILLVGGITMELFLLRHPQVMAGLGLHTLPEDYMATSC
jgi:hypothetical protein